MTKGHDADKKLIVANTWNTANFCNTSWDLFLGQNEILSKYVKLQKRRGGNGTEGFNTKSLQTSQIMAMVQN